jgi:TetR/AcrR family transcriptional regulator, ethionamide resistance regulator
MPEQTPQQIGRRRRPKHEPAESEREILQAAEKLLRERPLREITVARIMAETGLKRPAFWAHFRDRQDVIVRIVQHVAEELVEVSNRWLASDGNPEQDLLAALNGIAAVYARQGAVLRALADAAASDEQTERVYRAVVQSLQDATAAKIRTEQSRGRVPPTIDAEETARALVWLNERYFYDTLGQRPDADPAPVVAVLHRIWLATLYDAVPGSDGARGLGGLKAAGASRCG